MEKINEIHIAGNTLSFNQVVSDYLPADGWVLSYVLINESDKITITGSDNGDGSHLVAATPVETASWNPGEYTWTSFVNDGTDRHTIETGTITIKPDPVSATTLDGRSAAKKWLDALLDARLILAETGGGVVTVSMNGRTVTYDKPGLHAEIARAKREVAAESPNASLGYSIQTRL